MEAHIQIFIGSNRTLGNPCARGYTNAHSPCTWLNILILVYISVRVAKSRARILFTNTRTVHVCRQPWVQHSLE